MRRMNSRAACAALLFVFAASCTPVPGALPDQVEPPPRVRIAVSVDWEGAGMARVNLRAFEAVRKALPDVPLTHFLNAAYFTKADADPEALTKSMRRVLRDGDEFGLHIHPWRSLVESAGVTFRSAPTVWGRPTGRRSGERETGHAVVIESYEIDELQAVIRKSREILRDRGFAIGTSFRAGAWLAGRNVREAIRREGFLVDSSATDPGWHEELERFALPKLIRETWPEVTPESQPFWIATPAGPLLEMPDTGALADYVTAEEMADHVAAAVVRMKESGRDIFVHLGFHQETAARYGMRIREAIAKVRSKHGRHVVFETLASSATRARSMVPSPKAP